MLNYLFETQSIGTYCIKIKIFSGLQALDYEIGHILHVNEVEDVFAVASHREYRRTLD
jgi:hypothetical protein